MSLLSPSQIHCGLMHFNQCVMRARTQIKTSKCCSGLCKNSQESSFNGTGNSFGVSTAPSCLIYSFVLVIEM